MTRMGEVFLRNPDHPGAPHYIIHAFDDETHAPLALYAARVYGQIAPDVVHALHMPAHIFVQRGLWDEVVGSNRRAYDTSVAWARAQGVSDTRRDFHALFWLHYGRLQQGRLAEARGALDEIRPIAERELTTQRVKATLSNMTARYILDTGQWQTLPEAVQAERYGGDAYMLLAAGVSAARTGHLDVAEQAAARLRELGTASTDLLRSALQGQVTLEDLQRSVQIGHHEVLALISLANGRGHEALVHMDQAVAIEKAMHPSYGPPEPMVPPRELYGQILLELDRPVDAAAKFADLLLHRPNRTQSMLGLARAAAKAGDRTTAKAQYEALTHIWAPDTELPGRQEAKLFLSETDEP